MARLTIGFQRFKVGRSLIWGNHREVEMTLTSGQLLNNRYNIKSALGKGGFGAVYRAWDTNLERECAIKENLDPSVEAERQFKREAKILVELVHPNLPRVFDTFIISGQGQYLVMDYIDGEDLGQMLKSTRGPLPVSQVLPWIIQVGEALSYLHSLQPPVIHRDVKPANIRINAVKGVQVESGGSAHLGKAVLVDFGIAKVFDPQLKTTVGARAITPGYSPPEQYGTGITDPRTDVYALGATLYHLITGQIPTESVQRTLGAAVKPPRQLNPDVDEQLESVILKAIDLIPGRRFADASEFIEAMSEIKIQNTRVEKFPDVGETLIIMPNKDSTGNQDPGESLSPASALPHQTPDQIAVSGTVQVIPELRQAQVQAYQRSGDTAVADPGELRKVSASVQSTGRKSSIASIPGAQFFEKIPTWVWFGGAGIIALGFIVMVILAGILFRRSNGPEEPASPVAVAISSVDPVTQNVIEIETVAPTVLPSPTATELIDSPTQDVSSPNFVDPQGIEMVLVPFGEFQMGSDGGDESANDDERPKHPVLLDEFYIDLTEVTNKMYSACVESSVCPPPANSYTYSIRDYYGNAEYDNYPVVWVEWGYAKTYCEWRGARLPTEAEWEKAARGADGQIYPWGDDFDSSRANSCDKDCPLPGGDYLTFTDGYPVVAPAGSFLEGVSPYGLFDMAGNVWEWVSDWYQEDYYPNSPSENPTGPDSGVYRLIKGGSWGYVADSLRAAQRRRVGQTYRDVDIGFRCARSP
jgi:formylglycine-generating enzyme required for sulfatase activity